MSKWKQYLDSIYFDPKHPGSYAGPEKLYQIVKSEGKYKIGKYRIRKWLQEQDSYSLTRGVRRHFTRNRVIVEGIDSQWDIDLADMSQLHKDNDGYKYLLVAIDIFSRYTWCQPLKSKEGQTIVTALKKILDQGRRPNIIRTDKGGEFKNRKLTSFLNNEKIHHFVTQNETKANYCERVIKTLKQKLFRYIMKKRSPRYIDGLQDVVYSYNHTFHRSLGQSPTSVTDKTEDESRLQQYLLRKKHKGLNQVKVNNRYKYKLGQTVRISHIRGLFDREYSQTWTGELFKVKTRYKREGIPVYTLEAWNGEPVQGTFYNSELQAVNVDENTPYSIDKILKKRTRNKVKEVLVHWLYWPKSYDSWIPENEIQQYT